MAGVRRRRVGRRQDAAARRSCSARARGIGRAQLSGDCVELGEGELPYAPLVGRAAPARALGRPRARRSSPARPAPSSRRCSPAWPARADARRRPMTRPRRRGCSRRCSRLLERLGARTGRCCSTIEDLHWADRATRAFLDFLARSLCRERVLVVATYRPDELHRRHPLRPLLAELERDAALAADRAAAADARRSWSSSWPTSSATRPTATLVDRAVRALRGQPAVRRGAARRRAATAAARCRRRCATR